MSQTPNLFLSIGKPLKDEYGRSIGRVASFAVTPSGKFDSVFVEQGDGKFQKHSVETLRVDGNDVILISKVKTDASAFCDQIPLIWRKDQALKELSEKKKVSPELYNELHRSFEGALNQLKNDAQGLSEETVKNIERCNEEMKALNYALVNLEIEHEIGKVNDQAYNIAFEIIQENLKRVNTEKADLELMKSKLSNIMLGDTTKTTDLRAGKTKQDNVKSSTTVYAAPELPEPPVVVYVKEIGKTGT
jgi:hypothetical protein